jgi:hypothetical protein
MALTPYEKVKCCRQRKRRGRAVLSIELDVGAVGDLLVETGFLEAWDANDRDKLREALEHLLDVWTAA